MVQMKYNQFWIWGNCGTNYRSLYHCLNRLLHIILLPIVLQGITIFPIWNGTKWNLGFNPLSAIFVIECTSSSSWGSRGWCAVLLISGQYFQLLLMTFYWHRMPLAAQRWCQNNVKYCGNIQIKYFLPKLCHLPQYLYRSRKPTTRVLAFASFRGLGTKDPYSHWSRWHSVATHT